MKSETRKSSLSLSDRIRQRGRTLAVFVADAIANGNRSDARKAMREAERDVATVAVGALLEFVDGPARADLARFLESFAYF